MTRSALRCGSAALALPALLLIPARASAQVDETLAVRTLVPQGYDRGRNISVLQQPRPDYDPLGVRMGAFVLFPRVTAGGGVTSNTYLTDTDKTSSAFVSVEPTVAINSDWSRHSFQFVADALGRDYIGQSRRRERTWSLDGTGRIDASRAVRIDANVDVSRQFENLFSAELGSDLAALSRYRRDFASLQATYTNGRVRSFVLGDFEDLRFKAIPLASGGEVDQSDRDRYVARLTGQVEYARSPTLSFFAQLGGARTNFDRDLLTGGPNLDSKAVRILGGANLDVAGRVRGTIGIGYSIQSYDAGIYPTVRGLSVDTRLEFFPLPRLSVLAAAQRTVENSALRVRLPFWNTRFRLRADYELLRNMILNASADYSRQNYIGSSETGNIYQFAGGAKYLASRRVNLTATLSYRHRTSSNRLLIDNVSEARAALGVAYQL